MEFELVINARSDGHDDRLWRKDVEVKKGRREFFEMLGSREEGEDFGKRSPKPKFAVKRVYLHEIKCRACIGRFNRAILWLRLLPRLCSAVPLVQD